MTTIDLHTHTALCDGNDSPADLVAEAYRRGFDAIGISGHSYVDFDTCCMTLEGTLQYRAEINALKQQYKGKMDVFLGLEQDYYSPKYDEGYDYIIGSVHYIYKDGEYISVDLNPDRLQKIIARDFGGFDCFAEEYYRLLSDVVNKTNCDIIGHFDLITKFIETHPHTLTDRYKKTALACVKSLIPHGKPFEINVGAMTRGYRTSPYPEDFILKEICRLGGKIVINGDCHNKNNLGDFFDAAVKHAKKCGFTERLILTTDGFKSEKL